MKVLGKQIVDYVSKKTGNPVKGVSLHCTTTRNDVEGTAVETIYISEKSDMYKDIVALPLNSEVICTYNRWGNVESVRAVKQ